MSKKVLMKDVCDVKGGKRIPKGHATIKTNTGYRYMRLTDCENRKPNINSVPFIEKTIYDRLKHYKVSTGDVYLSVVGTIGICGIIPEELDGVILTENANKLIIKDKNELFNEYLYYLLFSSNGQNLMKKGLVGSIQPKLPIYNIELFEFLLPNIQTQKSIAKVLSDLDAKIELNNKINKELEAMAKTLYDYWFVQFDFPFDFAQGKPSNKGKPYKTSGGKMVYNEVLKREIPEGWEVGTFETISTIIGGSTPSKAINENFTKERFMSWITPKDLSLNKGNKFITKGDWDVTELGIKSASLKIMPKNTVLLSSRAPIGYLAISREEVTTNQGFKSFVPKKNYSTEFVFYCVKNQIPKIKAYSSGSTFKEVSASTLKAINILIPNDDILKNYDSSSKPIFRKQNLLELENQQLTQLRDWLLPMLMNGQVRVGELDNKMVYREDESVLSQAAEPREAYKS